MGFELAPFRGLALAVRAILAVVALALAGAVAVIASYAVAGGGDVRSRVTDARPIA